MDGIIVSFIPHCHHYECCFNKICCSLTIGHLDTFVLTNTDTEYKTHRIPFSPVKYKLPQYKERKKKKFCSLGICWFWTKPRLEISQGYCRRYKEIKLYNDDKDDKISNFCWDKGEVPNPSYGPENCIVFYHVELTFHTLSNLQRSDTNKRLHTRAVDL